MASVGKICSAGNRVVFEPEGGYIQEISTGKSTPLRKQGHVYMLDAWVKARSPEDQVMSLEAAPATFSGQDYLPEDAAKLRKDRSL